LRPEDPHPKGSVLAHPASRGGWKPKPRGAFAALTFNTGMKHELGIYRAATPRGKDVNKASLGTFFAQRKNPHHNKKRKSYFLQLQPTGSGEGVRFETTCSVRTPENCNWKHLQKTKRIFHQFAIRFLQSCPSRARKEDPCLARGQRPSAGGEQPGQKR